MASISLINVSRWFPSTSIIKWASISSVTGTAVLSTNLLTIFKAFISTSSIALGVKPARKIALTASPAFSSELKGTNISKSYFGYGSSFKTIFVTIAKVPSLPTINCVKL